MDKDTRNRIERATQAARALLEQDFADQLEGVFDIRLDGTLATEPGSHLDAAQRVLRRKLVAAIRHRSTGGESSVVGRRSSAEEESSVVGRRSSAEDPGPRTDDCCTSDYIPGNVSNCFTADEDRVVGLANR